MSGRVFEQAFELGELFFQDERLGHHFKSDMHHHFVLNACEVQRFRRLSCFAETASNCVGCAGFLPSLAPSTDNPWSAVSALEIGDIPAVLSVS